MQFDILRFISVTGILTVLILLLILWVVIRDRRIK